MLDHLYIGGPVRNTSVSILVKSAEPLAAASPVTPEIYLIETFDQFNQLPLDKLKPTDIRIYSGYAGWAPGQLESELVRGDWRLWHAEPESVFAQTPETLWDDLIRMAAAQWVLR